MPEILPQHTVVSPVGTDFHTLGDFQTLLSLFNNGPYHVPQHLREKVMNGISQSLDDPDPRVFLTATKLLAEFEKINLQLAKTAMPARHEHINVKSFSDQELLEMIEKSKPMLEAIKNNA